VNADAGGLAGICILGGYERVCRQQMVMVAVHRAASKAGALWQLSWCHTWSSCSSSPPCHTRSYVSTALCRLGPVFIALIACAHKQGMSRVLLQSLLCIQYTHMHPWPTKHDKYWCCVAAHMNVHRFSLAIPFPRKPSPTLAASAAAPAIHVSTPAAASTSGL
jgi:hypothetical protein